MAGLMTTLIRKRLEYRRNRSMTRAQLEAWKLEKFRRLARHAHRHSPYYREIVDEGKIDLNRCTPEDFPVLTRSTLLERFDDIVTDRRLSKQVVSDFLVRSTAPDEMLFDRYHVLHTSGTTGQTAFFLFTEAEWACGLMQGRRRQRNLFRIGLRRCRVAYYGATGGHYAGVSMICQLRRGIAKWFVDLALLDVGEPLSKTVSDLNEFQPDVLCGYTSALRIIAREQLSGALNISPRLVGTGGEGRSLADHDMFRDVWGCESGNSYACSEHLVMGAARADGRTVELCDDDMIYEFHDDHLITTNLFNYTQPLIRYRMSDILRPVEQDRSTEPYLLIDSVVGRAEFVPWFVNREGREEAVGKALFVELFVPGLNRFQMRYIDKTRFQYAVYLEQGLDDAARAACVAEIRSRIGAILARKQLENVRFEVVVEDEVPLNPRTGKFDQFVKQPARGLQSRP